MQKLSEIKGDRAFEVLADLIDPVTEIISDPEARTIFQGGNKIKAVRFVLSKYKKQLTTILAVLDGEDPETYEPTLVEIPIKTIQLLNDPAIVSFFGSQAQSQDVVVSGSATETTEATNE